MVLISTEFIYEKMLNDLAGLLLRAASRKSIIQAQRLEGPVGKTEHRREVLVAVRRSSPVSGHPEASLPSAKGEAQSVWSHWVSRGEQRRLASAQGSTW